jgi:cyclase
MLAKRIIPCLDIRDGKVVKSIKFINTKDVGDPVERAIEYNRQGADELVFYDITASYENRSVMLDVVRQTAKEVFIPLCVGGGIDSVERMREVLRAGADKVSLNTAAVKNPGIIKKCVDIFGSQCVVVGIDAKRGDSESGYLVTHSGGHVDTKIDLLRWVKDIVRLGAGEICLNSMDVDGVKGGFDIQMLNDVCRAIRECGKDIPVIASGGCGSAEDMLEVFRQTPVTAALAASMFHYNEMTVGGAKALLSQNGVNIRI